LELDAKAFGGKSPPNRHVLPEPPKKVLTPANLGKLEVSTVAETSTFINVILYGDSGVGKTRLAGTASLVPEMSPVLFLDIEGGVKSLAHLYRDVHVIRIKTFDELQMAYNELFDGGHPYKTVVVDSLTEVQKFGMYHIMKNAVAADGNRDPDLPGIGEWGKNTNQVEKFVRAFRDLPLNTIFTALKMEDRNPRTGVTTTLPSLSGKLARNVSALVDVVGFFYVKKMPGEDEYFRLLLTQKTEEIVAKDRSDNLPAVVVDPTMQKLYDYITHKIPRDSDSTVKPEEVNEHGIEG
jgi:hypothetical protein